MAYFDCCFTSYTLDRDVEIGVVIPSLPLPGNIAGEKRHRVQEPYPILILLHGGGNNYHTWFHYAPVERYGEERNLAIVSISGENSEFEDQDEGLKMGTFLEKELMDFLTANFPVSGQAKDHYIAGLSMGGAGARMQVLRHPENYGAFGMFSSGANRMNMNDDCFDPENVINKKELIMPEVKARMREIAEQGIPFPKAYIACGQKDCLYPCSMAWAQFLKEMGYEAEFDGPGEYAHEWDFWELEIRKFMDWLPRTDGYYRKSPKRLI